jgi:hypothetical protein
LTEKKKEKSVGEMVKERWNDEVEGIARSVQETDWDEMRERWEERGRAVWDRLTGNADK